MLFRYLTAYSILFVLIFPNSVNSKISEKIKISNSVPIDSNPVFVVTELLKKIKKENSITARRIKRASIALRGKKYRSVRALTSKIKKEALFSDYGYFLEGQSFYVEAKFFLKRKKYQSARQAFQKSIQNFYAVLTHRSETPFMDKALLQLSLAETGLAQSLYHLKSYRRALNAFERSFERYGRRKLRIFLLPSSLKEFAQFCRTYPKKECENRLRWLLRSYPEHSPEREIIYKNYRKSKKWEINFPVIQKTTKKYRGSDKDTDEINHAFDDYWEERYSRTAERFQEILFEYPKTIERSRLRFWAGESLRLDREPKSAELFFKLTMKYSPLSFYALAASHRLNSSPQVYFSATLPEATAFDQRLTPKDAFHLKRARKFYSEGVYEFLGLEISKIRLRPFYQDSFLIFLVGLSHAAGAHLNVFRIYSELIARDNSFLSNSFQLKATFPKPYWNLIQKISAELKIDPILVLSLIKQESSFVNDIQSSSGASGLMQLMSFTALEVAPKGFQIDLVDPGRNIYMGSKYLRKMIRKFNGNWAYALAGYNAGPHRLKQWLLGKPTHRNLEEFIEFIPYSETRNYVRSIIKNYYWYHYLIKGESLLNFNRFFSTNETKH